MNTTIDRITELLRIVNLTWLLPNLRQDIVVWNSLNEPELYEWFTQLFQIGTEIKPSDFSPGKLALLALHEYSSVSVDPGDLLDRVDSQHLQMAIRSFNDQSLLQADPQNLATAGLIALALTFRYQTTKTWSGLLDAIQDMPGRHWLAPLTCLFGYCANPMDLLTALVQPGASMIRFELAVHTVLSNPIPPEEQVNILMDLCTGTHGDLLPARERLALLQSLFEQRPQSAQDFCTKWLEIHSEAVNPDDNNHHLPIENIDQLAETLFQIEVNKIAGKTQNLPELLYRERDTIQKLLIGVTNHYASHVSRYQTDKTMINELLTIRSQILHTSGLYIPSERYTPEQAELALLLADQGFEDEANQLLPNPEASLPEDASILYSIAILAQKAGDGQRANAAVRRILDILSQKTSLCAVPVWGDHLSLVKLSVLLMELHKPEEASTILSHALQMCPNDESILKLLAEAYKFLNKDQECIEILRILVALKPEKIDHHREFAQSLEKIGDWGAGLCERSLILELSQEQSKTCPVDDIYAYANCALFANQPDLTLKICGELQSGNQEDSQALIYSGKAYLQKNETDKGLELLLRATQVSPNLPEAWIALAEAQKQIYPIKTVIETLNNATQAVPESSQIHFMLGELYLQDHAPTLASPELHVAVDLSPEEPHYLVKYGLALKLLGHLEESCAVLAKAYQLEPNLPGLAQLYAQILVDMGQLEDAISPLENLMSSKASTDPMLYMDYARCVLSLIKHGSNTASPMKALIALNEVLQIDPELAEAKALIAESLTANGDLEMAFQAYREALDTSLIEDKNWLERLSFGFGCVASATGKHDIAIAALQEAGQANPNNPAIYKSLSEAYLEAGLPEDSIRSARNLLVSAGEDPENLSWFAYQAAKLILKEKAGAVNSPIGISKTVSAEALGALEKAIQLAPTRTDLLIQLGNLQSSIGAFEDAHATFTSIAGLDFAAIEDLKFASEYLSGIEDHSAAIACLENGISQDQARIDGHDASLYIKLAQEFVKNNDHCSAINTLDSGIEILPEDDELVSLKIDLLLSLGQTIEALNCIEAELQKQIDGKINIELLSLASRINRSIGDFSAAIKYAQKVIASCTVGSDSDYQVHIPSQYRSYIAELFRALIQPDQAYNIINDEKPISASDFETEQPYLDYICLQTELALETGEPIRSEIQDIQLESTSPFFPRLMAIKARLMNKAGNNKQAEQIFQIAQKSIINLDHPANLPSWTATYTKYLTINSILEASLDLGLWEQAIIAAQQIAESASAEPLSYLNHAKAIALKAEFHNICNISDANNHKPAEDSVSIEAYNQFSQYLDKAKLSLAQYKAEAIIQNCGLTDDQIYRWQARAEIAFNLDESKIDPAEILIHPLTPGDAAAMIYHLHRSDLRDSNSDSVTRIIKIARSFPRNPAVLLQVALSIHDENPVDAMKSLQSVLEQNPYAKSPTIAFCNILLTKIALNLDEYQIARQAIEYAIDIWQDEPAWHFLAAQIYRRSSDNANAINHLMEATRLDPRNISYQLELGKVYFEDANDDPRILKQALKSFENVLQIDPKEVSALILLANAQYLLSDLDNAELNARNALMTAPNRADVYQLLSEINIGKNDFQGAYEYANKAIQLNPKDMQSTIILARSLSALGRHTEGLAKLDALVPAITEAKLIHLERVNILRKINGPRAGLNELKTLVNSYPGDFYILNALAKCYIEVGDLENGVKTAQQALNTHTEKTSRNEQANLHLLIGQVLRQSGQLEQSIQQLNRAIQLSPDRLEPYLELGLACKEQREYQQALKVFEQASSIAPDDPRALFQAGLALKESKDYKSSEIMLRRAVSLAPNDLSIRRQLAAVVALNLVHNPRTGKN